MSLAGRLAWAVSFVLAISVPLRAASLTACSQGARSFSPCELSFEWRDSELPSTASPYKEELLNVEFRSPRHTTFLMRGFWDGSHTLRVRFTPIEPGPWSYHITSALKRYNNQEATFSVADSASPGFVGVANVRHWWTTNKQPHLWLAASVPFLELDQPALESWLDLRKHDGFTHIRGPLLSLRAPLKPLGPGALPNFAYFATLDDRVLAAAARGFTLDLLVADHSFLASGALDQWEQRDPLIRYLIARYSGLNVTWQGIEHFEDSPGARALLNDMGSTFEKYDAFRHPRSTDARVSSSPLLADGWMNYLIEASPHPEVAAVEHQFTQAPEIHVITATDPQAFRDELWNATTNGEYPSVSYDALRNEANVTAIKTWFKIIIHTRHWELEPYFDVSGARAVGLEDVEYLAYAQKPGIVEISLPRHKYNPLWVNPINGEEIPLKDYKGEILSRQTPDTAHGWLLQTPREGHKESMLKSYRFDSQDPPIQEAESDSDKIPYRLTDPAGDEINTALPTPFEIKLTKANRATRQMQIVLWGEIVGGSEGARLLGVGSSGNFTIPKGLVTEPGATLHLRVMAINANGKAYELDKVYRLRP